MAKTVEEIANDLGISITTVRLVLNGNASKYRISQNTQKRINDYIAQHGYVLNYAARSLKLNKSDVLGLIIPRLSNPYFSLLAERLELTCREAGYQLITCCTYNDPQREMQLVASLLSRNVDGLFIAPVSLKTQEHHLELANKPVIIIDRDFGRHDVSVIVSDNALAAEKLTSAMICHDPSSFLFLAGSDKQPSISERIRGYHNAMAAAGLKVKRGSIYKEGDDSTENGQQMMLKYLDKNDTLPASLMTSSLPLLEGALNIISERYGCIPANLNIGTFDTHPMLRFLPNRIWTARQDADAIVRCAFHMLLNAIKGNTETVHKIVPMQLIQYAANGIAEK